MQLNAHWLYLQGLQLRELHTARLTQLQVQASEKEALQVLRKRVDLFWVPDLSELLAKVEEKRGNLTEAKRQLHYAHVAAYLSNRQTAEKHLAELDTVEI